MMEQRLIDARTGRKSEDFNEEKQMSNNHLPSMSLEEDNLDINLIFDKETGKFRKCEPFRTVYLETEADWNHLVKAIDFYTKYYDLFESIEAGKLSEIIESLRLCAKRTNEELIEPIVVARERIEYDKDK